MKIQFIVNNSQLYGANKILLCLLEYLKDKGHQVYVLLPTKGDMSVELERRIIKYDIIFYYSSFLYFKKTIKFLAYPLLLFMNIIQFPRICNRIKKNKVDLIYSNTSAENIGIFLAKILKKPHVSHIHEFMDEKNGVKFLFGKKQKKRFLNLSDKIIFVTKSVADFVMQKDNLDEKHRIIYNGLPIPKINIGKKKKKNKLNLGIVGILSPVKRQDLAIKYFKNIVEIYPDSILHIYGDKEGAYKKLLIAITKEFNLEKNIIFHGYEKNTDAIYQSIDILLMFTEVEGFGLVTVEAMLRGVPVVGYNNGGTAEIIENQKSGFLFENESQFTSAIKSLQDEETYIRIKNDAYQRAITIFNQEIYCSNIENFIINE